jgi:hypothetical protein
MKEEQVAKQGGVGGVGGNPPAPPQVQESELPTDPVALSDEDQAYIDALVKLMHSKQTAPKVEDMLESGPPERSIPETALMINNMMEQEARKGGKPPTLEVLFQAGIVVVSDLIEIGNAKGIFNIQEEGDVALLLQNTMQKYVEKGLAEGTIDPIELQQKAEAMMTPEDREAGREMAQSAGLPVEPNEHTAMEVYATKKMRGAGMLKGGR